MKKRSCRLLGRVLGVFLTGALLLSALPLGLTASAAGMKGAYFVEGNPPFAYLVTGVKPEDPENTVKLYQNENMQSYEGYTGTFEIPGKVYNLEDMRTYTVTEIAGARASSPGGLQGVGMQELVLPGTVTDIGSLALADCYSLSRITFPTSVKDMAPDAFQSTRPQELTLDVVAEAQILSDTAYVPAGRTLPISLPIAVTNLTVRSPLTVAGRVEIPGSTQITGSRITVQNGGYLTLRGPISGTGVIQVSNDAVLTLEGSTAAYSGSVRLTGAISKLVNSTAYPVSVVDASGKAVTVKPGETRTGGQQDEEPSVDPADEKPQIISNYGGTVTVQEGGKVVVITALSGYRVAEVVINGLPMGDVTRYEFQEASAENTVAVTFEEGEDPEGPQKPVIDPVFRFTDLSPTAPYASAVRFLVNNGIFQGVSATRFAPDQKVNRAMFVSLFKRMEVYGEDFQVDCEKPILPIDVPADAWYAEAASWAVGTGIVWRESEALYGSRLITWQEVAMCLSRYTHRRGYDTYVSQSSMYSYKNIQSLPIETRRALAWAGSYSFIPNKNGVLNLTGTVTRAEIARVLAAYLQIY